jgi:hypothetical protein
MKITCPICKEPTTWEENPQRPFCSERCRILDLGRWAVGEYKVAGPPVGDQRLEEDADG